MEGKSRLGVFWALYAFVISALFGLTNPPFEAPDEPAHLNYVNHLVEHKTLPDQLSREMSSHGEGHQHPLYYISAGLVVAAFSGGQPIAISRKVVNEVEGAILDGRASRPTLQGPNSHFIFYTLRVFGALLVALLVLQVHRLAVLLRIVPLWPVVLAATLPQLLFISSSISNDGLTALLSACAICSTVEASIKGRVESWIKAGLWVAAAFLAKKSALVLFPAGLVLLLLTCRSGESFAKRIVGFCAVSILLALPLLLRNQIFYDDPLASAMELQTLAGLVKPRSITDSYFLTEFPMGLASSYVGLFGWTAVQVPMRVVALYWLLVLLGLIASLKGMRSNPQLLYLWLIVLLNVVGLIQYNLTFTQAQGRLLFPSLAAVACLWGFGVSKLTANLKKERQTLLLWLFAAFVIGLDIYSLTLNYQFYR